jgi:diguanylate cyclase (GGDEF)-like protein/PAS domain S-box-containing protein
MITEGTIGRKARSCAAFTDMSSIRRFLQFQEIQRGSAAETTTNGVLTRLHRMLATERDPLSLMRRFCEDCRELFGADRSVVVWEQPLEGPITLSSGFVADPHGPVASLMLDQLLRRRFDGSRNLLLIGPDSADIELVERLQQDFPDTRTALIAPINDGSQACGWVLLINGRMLLATSHRDAALLPALASLAARLARGEDEPPGNQESEAEAQASPKEPKRALSAHSPARLAGMIEAAMDAIISVDERFRIVLFNPAAERLFGYRAEQVLLQPLDLLLPMQHRRAHAEHIRKFGDSGISNRAMGRLNSVVGLHRDGRRLVLEGSIAQSVVEGRRIFTAFMRDVSEREQAQQSLRRLNRSSMVLSAINSVVARAQDRDELCREVCRVALDVGGFVGAWVALTPSADRSPYAIGFSLGGRGRNEEDESVRNDLLESLQKYLPAMIQSRQPAVFNSVVADPPSALRDAALAAGARSMIGLPLFDGDELLGLCMLLAADSGYFDAAELRFLQDFSGDVAFGLCHLAQRERLMHLALFDTLTGLANGTLFRDRLEQQVINEHQGRCFALALLDVERFKHINDALGRQSGDDLLRQLAERLLLASGDRQRLARVGSDQFALMLPETRDETEVVRLLAELHQRVLGKPFLIGESEVRLAARIGVALHPNDGEDAETLYRNAEAALKRAKMSGENLLFYSPKMTQNVAQRLTLESQMLRALERDEFVLHYQPKIHVHTRALVGVEALIRWQHPERGLVPPGQFIPLLEETGMILDVGRWALGRAVRDHRAWQERGLKAPRVAVNVSAVQLRKPDFQRAVEDALREAAPGSVAGGLDIEITESVIMTDIEATIGTLHRLREMGVNLSIDDFGTGYSSLAYLSKLPVQALKIDRAFVQTMLKDADNLSLVSTIISLAHALRREVVAEGVETEAEAKMLRLLRCDQIQGFLISRPVPFEALCSFIENSAQR